MRYLIAALSISLLLGCKQEGMTTSGICAWVKENYVHAQKTDALKTRKASAAQIKWYNDNC